jgi:hypothetical protein
MVPDPLLAVPDAIPPMALTLLPSLSPGTLALLAMVIIVAIGVAVARRRSSTRAGRFEVQTRVPAPAIHRTFR